MIIEVPRQWEWETVVEPRQMTDAQLEEKAGGLPANIVKDAALGCLSLGEVAIMEEVLERWLKNRREASHAE